MPKLFLDYVGMGHSDKPKGFAYSTTERADLVEAIWRRTGRTYGPDVAVELPRRLRPQRELSFGNSSLAGH